MKTTSSNNQYAAANNVLIGIISMLLGYNIYQVIYHPEKSNLLLCIALLIFTSAIIRKYETKKMKNE